MERANRKLWKINPGAGKDANFINRFGVLPFDPTGVGEIEKHRSDQFIVYLYILS